ncbi:MAG: hypothetical protein ACKOB9_03405 [Solirubrobacterales bacterium]
MLDPRIYRGALLVALLAVIVVAFSLENRPEPIRSTQAPAAFEGARAERLLERLAAEFPSRRPGSTGDGALARRVAGELRAVLPGVTVATRTVEGARTVDGRRDLVNVEAVQPGSSPGAGILVVAGRDALQRGSPAALSGTAALVELARAAALARPKRSVTFASVSGFTGGQAGISALVSRIDTPVDAVLVLGDMAGPPTTGRLVSAWSEGPGSAPLDLQRTVATALRLESGLKADVPYARSQVVRYAFPFTVGAQGPPNRASLPAVMLSASGELPPEAGAPVSAVRMERFGRAALRSLTALDTGPLASAAPQADLVTVRKVVPAWAVRLLVIALIFPALLTALDAVARLRRERQPVGRWLAWVAALAAPFAVAWGFLRLLGLLGLLDATDPPAPPGAVPLGGAGLGALICTVALAVLAALFLRPAIERGARLPDGREDAGATLAPALVACVGGLVAWIFNPDAAAVLILPAHIWLLACAREFRLPRAAAVGLVLFSLLPFVLAFFVMAGQLSTAPWELPWTLALGLAGGTPWLLVALGWALVAGAACGALALAWGAGSGPDRKVTVRGPVGYAGPGSLGGTPSARG